MSAYTYRALTAADAQQFRDLRRTVVAASPIGMGTTLDEELQQPASFFHSQLSFAAPSRVFGAFSEGELVAAAGIRWPTNHASGKHKTILYGAQTAPAFRRQSLGRRLVRQAVDHAFSSGCLRIYLYVYVPNPGAVSLYESLGFVSSGAEPEELNIDGHYYDLQYMSLRNPAPLGAGEIEGVGSAA